MLFGLASIANVLNTMLERTVKIQSQDHIAWPKLGELISESDVRITFTQHWLYRTSDHIPHGLGNFAQNLKM